MDRIGGRRPHVAAYTVASAFLAFESSLQFGARTELSAMARHGLGDVSVCDIEAPGLLDGVTKWKRCLNTQQCSTHFQYRCCCRWKG